VGRHPSDIESMPNRDDTLRNLQRNGDPRSFTRTAAANEYDRAETIMTQLTSPSKFAIRQYLDRRTHSSLPPPSMEEIRRQLGWQLVRIGNAIV